MSPATATFCMFFFDAAFVAVLLPLLLLPFFLALSPDFPSACFPFPFLLFLLVPHARWSP
jgi:hypothetical protein